MKCLFIHYPKCTTCINAKKFLLKNEIEYVSRDIKEDNPSEKELREWYEISKLPLKKFFNTNGQLYKLMELAKKLPNMNEDEQLKLLSTNGMLIKRPILVKENNVLVGFKAEEWEDLKNEWTK
jgi:arsenate reductase (glutaredoxin)